MAAQEFQSQAAPTLTHKDLAARLGVSETTIKSYRRKFPEFFPVHSRGKPIRFQPQAEDVSRLIQQCFHENLSVEETRAKLGAGFPVLGAKERLDPARNRPASQRAPESAHELAEAVQGLRQGLEQLGRLQNLTNERLDKLQGLMAQFLDMQSGREDALAKGLDEMREAWAGQLGSLEKVLGEKVQARGGEGAGRDRRIVVKNAYGGSSEYVFRDKAGQEGEQANEAAQEPAATEAAGESAVPPGDILALPLVVEAGPGEYLGVAGRAAGPFSLSDFMALLAQSYPPPKDYSLEWRSQERGWLLRAEQANVIRPKRLELMVDQTRTPRGNLVAVLERLEENGVDQPPANLFAFIKKMKEMGSA